METIGICDARTRFSHLVDRAAAGDDVVISRKGKPLERPTRLAKSTRQVRFGLLAGQVKVAGDFDAPLPDSVVAAFEGR
jgi:antitoxin (DNA-binding transcriptional repressor) of toxin-antitoxin stability system